MGSGAGGQPVGDDDQGTGNATSGTTAVMPDGTSSATHGGSAEGPTTELATTDDGVDTTDGETNSGDTAASESSGSTGTSMPQQEELANSDFSGCGLPFWCVAMSNPVAQDQWMQECFNATLPTPFELNELEFLVNQQFGEVDSLSVEVYSYVGEAGPGPMLASTALPTAGLVDGVNTMTLDPPLIINQPNICIGLASLGGTGALGVSVSNTTVDDTAFFRLSAGGGGGCEFPNWTSHTGFLDGGGSMRGNWCIRATIESDG